MATYIRVKNKTTKHEYDILEHRFDPEQHTRVNRKHYPPTSVPRNPKPYRPIASNPVNPSTP